MAGRFSRGKLAAFFGFVRLRLGFGRLTTSIRFWLIRFRTGFSGIIRALGRLRVAVVAPVVCDIETGTLENYGHGRKKLFGIGPAFGTGYLAGIAKTASFFKFR